jgi:hypothetical protein
MTFCWSPYAESYIVMYHNDKMDCICFWMVPGTLIEDCYA